jgi:hypothetical protein
LYSIGIRVQIFRQITVAKRPWFWPIWSCVHSIKQVPVVVSLGVIELNSKGNFKFYGKKCRKLATVIYGSTALTEIIK